MKKKLAMAAIAIVVLIALLFCVVTAIVIWTSNTPDRHE